MKRFSPCRGAACLLATMWLAAFGQISRAAPQVFWASDPVRPNETVLLQGADFAGQPRVEVTRLADGDATAPAGAGDVGTAAWTAAAVLQGSDCSLKFALPADWKMGVFACRVTAAGATSAPVWINAPDPWWVQGDRGAACSPGGWLRVFGKSLHFGGRSAGRLVDAQGRAVALSPVGADGFALRFDLPADLKPGPYALFVHNGFGGQTAWRKAGEVKVEPPEVWPTDVFSVLDFYGQDAARDARKTLVKYRPVPDRTEGLQAALNKARANGGGIVYFPAGRYGLKGEIQVPPRTVLKGEGTGLVVLWWGSGRFNLDGGSDQGLAGEKDLPEPPGQLLTGRQFALEDVSLYVPLNYRTVISADEGFRMRRVRVRIDHYWLLDGRKRPEGVIARLGTHCEVSDCDILAKGTGLITGQYNVVARNLIRAGKTNCTLGGSQQTIVEDNRFVSTYPTAYENIAGVGRNIYYARNRHEALNVHQADYSFTFDAGSAAYFGKVSVEGTQVTLAEDPTYPKWAPEKSDLWRRAVVCIQDGRGAGQWRRVVANRGRQWEIDRPFDCPPDATSLVTIVPFNGRVLLVGNRFEDANWVNAGYGTSIDVVYAGNSLYRCAQLLNYGCAPSTDFQPCWYVQYFDNELHEGQTSIDTTGSIRDTKRFPCPITRCTIHRRQVLDKDTGGSITVSGQTRDVIVEGCVLGNEASTIRADGDARGVLFRDNTFASGAAGRYEGSALKDAVILPATPPAGQ